MCVHLCLQLSSELTSGPFTGKWFVLRMGQSMAFQLRVCTELFATNVANLGICVKFLVDSQVIVIRVDSSTPFKPAEVFFDLGLTMLLHVSVEGIDPCE